MASAFRQNRNTLKRPMLGRIADQQLARYLPIGFWAGSRPAAFGSQAAKADMVHSIARTAALEPLAVWQLLAGKRGKLKGARSRHSARLLLVFSSTACPTGAGCESGPFLSSAKVHDNGVFRRGGGTATFSSRPQRQTQLGRQPAETYIHRTSARRPPGNDRSIGVDPFEAAFAV